MKQRKSADMKRAGHGWGGVLCCALLLLGLAGAPAFSQQVDPDRAARIREQLGAGTTRRVGQADLDSLRDELKLAMEAIVLRINSLEREIIDLKARMRVLEVHMSSGAAGAPGAEALAAIEAADRLTPKMKLTVCAGNCDASTLGEALLQVAPGGTIALEPGAYSDCLLINKPVKLIGAMGADGGRAQLLGTACDMKAAVIIAASDVTVQGLKISGISPPGGTGACIQVDPVSQTALIRDVLCQNSATGLKGGVKAGGKMIVEESVFEGNGAALDVSGGDAVLRKIIVLAANDGRLLITRAKSLLIEDSVFAALSSTSGRLLDASSGGKITITNSVFQHGPNSRSAELIAYGSEDQPILKGVKHMIVMENNWIISDGAAKQERLLLSKSSKILGPIIVQNNKFVGAINPVFSAIDMRLNKEYADRPAAQLQKYDGTLNSLPAPGS